MGYGDWTTSNVCADESDSHQSTRDVRPRICILNIYGTFRLFELLHCDWMTVETELFQSRFVSSLILFRITYKLKNNLVIEYWSSELLNKFGIITKLLLSGALYINLDNN